MVNLTTVESDPEAAASFLRSLKFDKQTIHEEQPAEEEETNWFDISSEEVKEKLGKKTIWDEPPVHRGRAFEELRAANLGSNYPTIDDIRIDAGTATSMKTLNLLTQSYQNVDNVDAMVRSYVDKLSGFTGFNWNGQEYQRGRDFNDLYLELGIPNNDVSKEQANKLHELQGYAQGRNVRLVIVKVP